MASATPVPATTSIPPQRRFVSFRNLTWRVSAAARAGHVTVTRQHGELDDHRRHTKYQHLRPDGAARVDELREQGDEENQRLGVCRLQCESAGQRSQRAPVFLRALRPKRESRSPYGLHAQIDQIEGSQVPDEREDLVGSEQNGSETQRGKGEVAGVAGQDAGARPQRRRPAASEAVRQHEQHRRTGREA